jgi:formylglycine-generating enzyme required for sulfatase activity
MADALDAILEGVTAPRDIVRSIASRYPELTAQLQALLVAMGAIRVVRHFSLPGYEVEKVIGRGGMGVVYRAQQCSLGRRVAIKVLSPWLSASPAAVVRFKREAKLIGMLRHPNIVTVLDAGEHDGHHYLVMEYVEGSDLAEMLKSEGAVTASVAIKWVRDAAVGLAYAHKRGVIHRDIKPSNLLYDRASQCIKVSDLGLGRLLASLGANDTDADVSTVDGTVIGTPGFIAPECIGSPSQADARSDVYGLGQTLSRLVHPYEERERHDKVACLKAEIRELISIATDVKPDRRFQTMDEFIAAIDGIGAGSVPAMQARCTTSRALWLIGACAVALAVLALAAQRQSGSASDKIARLVTRPKAEAGVNILNTIDMRLVLIPAGEFEMGTETDEVRAVIESNPPNETLSKFLTSESPRHRVKISRAFYLSTREVTLGQFRKFIAKTGFKTEAERDGKGGRGATGDRNPAGTFSIDFNWRNTGFAQSDDHPVVNISWYDAIAFCEWLSSEERATYRLPTEAEWEYACRAGTSTRYYFGDREGGIVEYGNVADLRFSTIAPDHYRHIGGDDGFAFTAPVGTYRPNAWGLFDMHGNVWEWCQDWFTLEYDGASQSVDPKGPARGTLKVARGGAWNSTPVQFTSAARAGSVAPTSRALGTGFRVVREP